MKVSALFFFLAAASALANDKLICASEYHLQNGSFEWEKEKGPSLEVAILDGKGFGVVASEKFKSVYSAGYEEGKGFIGFSVDNDKFLSQAVSKIVPGTEFNTIELNVAQTSWGRQTLMHISCTISALNR